MATLTAPSERKLIRRILDGDRGAAGELVAAHQGSLFAYMLRMSGRPDVAEDIVQEAFVRAFTNLHRYDERFRFSTWLFTIAKRLYVNARQRLAPAYDTEAMGIASDRRQSAAGSAPIGFARETSTNAADALQRALLTLSEDQREVIVLFYQLEWPVESIGEYLDIPVGTVKSHLHRARARLRDALAGDARIAAWLAEVPA